MGFRSFFALNAIKPLFGTLARRSPEWRGLMRDAIYVAEAENAERVTPELLALYNRRDAAYTEAYDADTIAGSELAEVANAVIAAKPNLVVEIGSSSGALAAYLARTGINVIGLDFNLDRAVQRYGNIANISFRAGYPLDLLAGIDGPFTVVATSTLVHTTRRELDLYFELLATKANRVIMREPVFSYRGFHAARPGDPISRSVHTKGMCWRHPFAPMLVARGYKITRFEMQGDHLLLVATKN